jgi:hypothetical protein
MRFWKNNNKNRAEQMKIRIFFSIGRFVNILDKWYEGNIVIVLKK